jgi:anti-sigma factor (TIGR02949 family)
VNCPDIQIKATAILDGEELPIAEREEVEQHLAACSDCTFNHGIESSIKRLVRTRLPYLTVPEQIYSRLRAQLDREPSFTDGSGASLFTRL